MYFYTIYTNSTSPILNYICYSWVYHTITTRWTYYNHTLDIIISVSFTTFQTYNIASCNHGHMPLLFIFIFTFIFKSSIYYIEYVGRL